MKKLALTSGLALALTMGYGSALAQDAGPEKSVVPTAEPAEPAAEEGSNADLLEKLGTLRTEYEALKAARAEGESLRAPVAGILLAITLFLLSVLKRVPKLTTRGKKWVPWAALGLGVLAGFLDHFAAGGSVAQSLMTGAGPGLAVLVHELTKLFKKD